MILVIVESPAKCKKESYLGTSYKCIASFIIFVKLQMD